MTADAEGASGTNGLDIGAIPLGDLVKERPSRIRVLERYGIDFYCRGKDTLATQCTARDLDLELVVREVSQCENDPSLAAHGGWGERSIGQLVDHIERHTTAS